MILRLGAAANSLQAILLNYGAAPDRPPLATSRDLVHISIIAASYVREVQFILDGNSESRERVWHLAKLGVKAGRDMPGGSLEELKELLDKSHPMQRRAHDVRRQLGFHVLPGDFRTWLRATTSNRPVVLAAMEDPTRADVVFVASAQAVADACQQPVDPAFFAAVTKLAFTLPYLVEAMCAGLAIEQGMTQSEFLKFRVSACLTGPARWDPSGPLKEN